MSADMFGREKEMDLGAPSARTGRPDPVPGATDTAPRGPYEPGRGVLGLFVVAVLAAGAFMFVTVEGDAVDDPVKQAARGEVTARGAVSLLREANLRKALRALDGELQAEGFIDTFRLDPTRLNAIVVQPSGRRESIDIDVAFDVTKNDAGTGEGEGLQIGDIDTAAPLKILRTAERRLGLKAADIDYLVASEPTQEGGEPTWTAFYKRPLKNNDVAAAGDGSDVRPLGTPDAKTRAEQRRAARLTDCLRQADTAEQAARCRR